MRVPQKEANAQWPVRTAARKALAAKITMTCVVTGSLSPKGQLHHPSSARSLTGLHLPARQLANMWPKTPRKMLAPLLYFTSFTGRVPIVSYQEDGEHHWAVTVAPFGTLTFGVPGEVHYDRYQRLFPQASPNGPTPTRFCRWSRSALCWFANWLNLDSDEPRAHAQLGRNLYESQFNLDAVEL